MHDNGRCGREFPHTGLNRVGTPNPTAGIGDPGDAIADGTITVVEIRKNAVLLRFEKSGETVEKHLECRIGANHPLQSQEKLDSINQDSAPGVAESLSSKEKNP